MELQQMILQQAQALKDEIAQWRQTLHRHPELGLNTPWTQEFVVNQLRSMGYEPKKSALPDILSWSVNRAAR